MNVKKFFLSILCVLAIFISTINVYATGTDLPNVNLTKNNIATENKIICKATLEDDFADDTILVVINKEYSKRETTFSQSHFKNIQIAEIRNLTTPISNLSTASATAEEAAQKANTLALTNVENFRQIIEIKLKNTGKENVLKAIKELEKIDYIESAEPNYYICPTPVESDLNELQIVSAQEDVNETPQPTATVPDDLNSQQYALSKIQATSAWDITTGSTAIRVGIIDSGISNHADLSGNLVSGWDFYNDNSITTDDQDGHGTHVAGIIGAKGNNGSDSICGVNWNVSLVPLQVSMYDREPAENGMHFFNNYAISKAIDYARVNNISIINCSFGSYNESPTYKAAMSNYSGLIVCSAGNGDEDKNPIDNDIYRFTPASFPFDNIVSVAATTQSDALVYYSNYGATFVDLGAPGYQVYSTYPTNTYKIMSGTSMAAPHVTGVAALIKSIRPDLSATQIKACILNGTDAISSLSGLCVTGGRLNAYKAVQLAVDFPVDQMVSGDFDGNGNDDIAYITDTGYGIMKIYVRLNGNGTATLWSQETAYYTGNVSDRVAAGDFNGDGKDDIALMYDNKNARTRIHVLLSNGSGFNSRSSWFVQATEGMYNANCTTGRFTSGDFNGDGKDDISAMHDNGDGKMRIHMFISTGGSFNLEYWYEDMVGGNFYAAGVTGRYEAGDFNGDGKDDIAAMYGYADGRTRTHVWLSNGTSLNQRTAWFIQDTPYYYNTDRVTDRFVAGDFNADGKDDIATLYRYDNGTMMIHVFVSQGNTYSWWQKWFHSSIEGNFYADAVKAFNAGDYNGDGKMDIMARYVYSAGNSNLLKYQSIGSAFTYSAKFPY